MEMQSSINFYDFSKFFEDFKPTDIVSDPLPLKVLNHSIASTEVGGQAIYWAFQYLYQKNCPYRLLTPLLKRFVEVISTTDLSDCAVSDLKEAYDVQDGVNGEDVSSTSAYDVCYQPLKLMQTVTGKIDEVCLELKDKSGQALDQVDSTPNVYDISFCTMKNTRRSLEDRMIILPNLDKIYSSKLPASYFAIFDGHNGVEAAAYAAAQLHQNLLNNQEYPADIALAIRNAFNITDENFLDKCARENIKSGATAVVALVDKARIYVAWAGDSQAVLVKSSDTVSLVSPHKPEREDEMQRIKDVGGDVLLLSGTWRVNGNLAVSRAIGDFDYKNYIISTPEVRIVDRDDEDEFLIIACDGLWDDISPQRSAQIVRNYVANHGKTDLEGLTQKMASEAKKEGCGDNITIIVVFLQPIEVIADRYRSMQVTEIKPDVEVLSQPDVDWSIQKSYTDGFSASLDNGALEIEKMDVSSHNMDIESSINKEQDIVDSTADLNIQDKSEQDVDKLLDTEVLSQPDDEWKFQVSYTDKVAAPLPVYGADELRAKDNDIIGKTSEGEMPKEGENFLPLIALNLNERAETLEPELIETEVLSQPDDGWTFQTDYSAQVPPPVSTNGGLEFDNVNTPSPNINEHDLIRDHEIIETMSKVNLDEKIDPFKDDVNNEVDLLNPLDNFFGTNDNSTDVTANNGELEVATGTLSFNPFLNMSENQDGVVVGQNVGVVVDTEKFMNLDLIGDSDKNVAPEILQDFAQTENVAMFEDPVPHAPVEFSEPLMEKVSVESPEIFEKADVEMSQNFENKLNSVNDFEKEMNVKTQDFEKETNVETPDFEKERTVETPDFEKNENADISPGLEKKLKHFEELERKVSEEILDVSEKKINSEREDVIEKKDNVDLLNQADKDWAPKKEISDDIPVLKLQMEEPPQNNIKPDVVTSTKEDILQAVEEAPISTGNEVKTSKAATNEKIKLGVRSPYVKKATPAAGAKAASPNKADAALPSKRPLKSNPVSAKATPASSTTQKLPTSPAANGRAPSAKTAAPKPASTSPRVSAKTLTANQKPAAPIASKPTGTASSTSTVAKSRLLDKKPPTGLATKVTETTAAPKAKTAPVAPRPLAKTALKKDAIADAAKKPLKADAPVPSKTVTLTKPAQPLPSSRPKTAASTGLKVSAPKPKPSSATQPGTAASSRTAPNATTAKTTARKEPLVKASSALPKDKLPVKQDAAKSVPPPVKKPVVKSTETRKVPPTGNTNKLPAPRPTASKLAKDPKPPSKGSPTAIKKVALKSAEVVQSSEQHENALIVSNSATVSSVEQAVDNLQFKAGTVSHTEVTLSNGDGLATELLNKGDTGKLIDFGGLPNESGGHAFTNGTREINETRKIPDAMEPANLLDF